MEERSRHTALAPVVAAVIGQDQRRDAVPIGAVVGVVETMGGFVGFICGGDEVVVVDEKLCGLANVGLAAFAVLFVVFVDAPAPAARIRAMHGVLSRELLMIW